MAPLDRRHRNREVLSLLLEKASVQGYLTTDDLLEVSPEVGEDAERLSVIMLALRHRGVDVVDPEILDAPPTDILAIPGLEPWIEPEPLSQMNYPAMIRWACILRKCHAFRC